MRYVESSSVEAIGYDKNTQQLHVRFLKSGATYAYYDVDEWVFDEFRQAESRGRYFNDHIKEVYDYARL